MGIVGCGSSPPKDLQQSDNEEEKMGNKMDEVKTAAAGFCF
jgi:hypothetical protein